MKLRGIIKLSVFIFFAIVTTLQAQDLQFTQFYANPLYLNPAFAGSVRCPRICMNYRNQWPNLSGTYVSYSASYDQHVDAINGGLGFIVTQDDQAHGTLKSTQVGLIYSYHLAISRKVSIRASLQAGFFQKTLDKTKLNFGDMIDARRGFVWNTNEQIPSQSKTNLDFSGGAMIYSKRYYLGIAGHHLTQPDEGLQGSSKLPLKITAHAGAMVSLEKGNESFISPNILFQQQQNFTQLNLGMYFVKGNFVGGLWYRNSDAFIVLIGLQADHLKIGYSYDVTISKLSNNTAGSHEVSLQIQFGCKKPRPRHRPDSCPSF
ncbi:MAG: type IX secretion system membrane protein PorP/SprF [Bacteroidetes bacterium]|jgi:type IX secretion system PorP/SprF family membrane protein|nr:type IX secretion system membrane protein PorP/SprF [Bacteroidota bacterium]